MPVAATPLPDVDSAADRTSNRVPGPLAAFRGLPIEVGLTDRPTLTSKLSMDKKAKKRIELLNKRLQKLRQQLAGVRQQLDDPGELAKFEEEIRTVETEIATLKES